MLGERFEAEIREQPEVWRSLAASDLATTYADAVRDADVVLVGSGSSLVVAMLGALALRRRGVRASAMPATEAAFEGASYRGRTIVALSQSGRSADVLAAIETLAPGRLVALTNDARSPLAARADLVLDVAAGRERAIPASKSVTAMVAVVLWGAAATSGATQRNASTLRATADDVEAWLGSPAIARIAVAAERIARRSSVAVVGAGYGVPIARELALKLKEASYVHAEGFAAGEFRHGSAAILDATTTLVGIVDDASATVVRRPLAEAERTESLRYTIGGEIAGIEALGAPTGAAFNTLAWLVAGQMLALAVGRARGVDSDAPRGLTKFVL
ncbi:MAG: hypothetical protein NVSMB59_03160 [Vulcanimicrobiaceae bacterium]